MYALILLRFKVIKIVCGLTNFREFSFNNNNYYCYCYCYCYCGSNIIDSTSANAQYIEKSYLRCLE